MAKESKKTRFASNKDSVTSFLKKYHSKKTSDIFRECIVASITSPSSSENEERWNFCEENENWKIEDTTFRSEKAFKTFSEKYEKAFQKRKFEKILSQYLKSARPFNVQASSEEANENNSGVFQISFTEGDFVSTLSSCFNLIESIVKMMVGGFEKRFKPSPVTFPPATKKSEIDSLLMNIFGRIISHLEQIRFYGLLDFYTFFIYWCDENLYLYSQTINPSLTDSVSRKLSDYIIFTNPIHKSLISTSVTGNLKFFFNDIETIQQYVARYHGYDVDAEAEAETEEIPFEEMTVEELVEASTQAFLGLNLDEETREVISTSLNVEDSLEEEQPDDDTPQIGTPICFDGKTIQPGIPIQIRFRDYH